jgi:hypothetical protein
MATTSARQFICRYRLVHQLVAATCRRREPTNIRADWPSGERRAHHPCSSADLPHQSFQEIVGSQAAPVFRRFDGFARCRARRSLSSEAISGVGTKGVSHRCDFAYAHRVISLDVFVVQGQRLHVCIMACRPRPPTGGTAVGGPEFAGPDKWTLVVAGRFGAGSPKTIRSDASAGSERRAPLLTLIATAMLT